MRCVRMPGWTGDAPWRLVWLPGAAMVAGDIVARGYEAVAAAQGLAIDLMAVDLQAARMDGADALEPLVAQQLRPARATGVRICLAGISLGGWQAVLCAQRWPDAVDALCLLSPYPGERGVWRRIEAAGGLDAWVPPAVADDPVFDTWAFWRRPPATLPVWMGYGRRDRFADGMARMAARLPAAAVQVIDGDHDWACWDALWRAYVAQARHLAPEAAP